MKRLFGTALAALCGVLPLWALEDNYVVERAALETKLAAQPTNGAVLLALAKLCHNHATLKVADASDAAALAEKYLNRLLQQDPKHAFGRALRGSIVVVSAKEAWLPTDKISRVRRGLAEMDAAIKDSPDDENARFTRASNNLFLPEFFGRKEIVLADFAWLQERADRGRFDSEFRQYVCLFHGRAQEKYGEKARARKLWQDGIAIDPKSKVADELRRALDPGEATR
jgi:tetratricopeptide (TPR) repeat protein